MIGSAEHGEPETNRDWALHSQPDLTVVYSIEEPPTPSCTMELQWRHSSDDHAFEQVRVEMCVHIPD